METIITDVLVIGAGAAAARAAIEAAGAGISVHLVDKGEFGESGTSARCLQGLSTTLNNEDRPERFVQDWIRSGSGICDQNLVWEAVTQSQKVVENLEAMGMEFIRNPDGSRLLYRGAGHSVARGLTVKSQGAIGPRALAVLRTEAMKRGVRIHENILVTKLLGKSGRVIGAVGISPKRELLAFNAKAVILAAGGANRLYPTVPPEIRGNRYRTTGDSFYLAFEAGVPLIDMEFAQFRESPPGASRYGGKYLNALGERFMENYEPEALEKAPRHKVVEAVYREIKAGRGPIMWEVEGIREAELTHMAAAKRYTGNQRIEIGLDFQRLLGGVRINERAETIVPGLFAAGESSGGVQGGGRMQGDAFLETQVFGANAGKNAATLAHETRREKIDPAPVREEESRLAPSDGNINPAGLMKRVQETMWEQVGVVRDAAGLRGTIGRFEQLRKEMLPRISAHNIFTKYEANNLLLTAEMIARAALTREETRGAQVRSDYPETDDTNWTKHVCITNKSGEIAISMLPVIIK